MNTQADKNAKRDSSDQSPAKKDYVRPELIKKQKLALISGQFNPSDED